METKEERIDDELKIDTSRYSPNYSSRNGITPDVIVLHISEGYYDSGIDWLCNKQAQASSHFFVGQKGQVAQLVDLSKAAWCNGTSLTKTSSKYHGKSVKTLVRKRKLNANLYTISIEFEGFYKQGGTLTDKQHKKAVSLLVHIRKQIKKLYGYNIPLDREHVMLHCEVTPVSKPYCGKNIDIDKILLDANQKIK